jgi:hypothetical protein
MMKLPTKSVSNRQWKIASVVASWVVIMCLRAIYELRNGSSRGGAELQPLNTTGSWDEESAECMLFQSWNSEPGKELSTLSDGDLEGMLQEEVQQLDEGVRENATQKESMDPVVQHESSPIPQMQPQTGDLAATASQHVRAVASTSWGQGLLDLQQNLDRQIKKTHLAQAEKHLAHQHQAWDKAFSAEIASYEHELCEDPSRQHYSVCIRLHNAEKASESDALEENYNHRRAESDEWTAGLQDLQKRLEERRQKLHHKHHAHSRLSSRHVSGMAAWAADLEALHKQVKDASPSSSSSSSSSSGELKLDAKATVHATKWSLELEALQQRMEARQGKQQQTGEHDILPGDTEDDDHHLLNRIVGLNQQLCEDPQRRALASCAQFRAEGSKIAEPVTEDLSADGSVAKGSRLRGSGMVAKELQEHDQQVRHLKESHREWEEAFSAKVAAQMREMCSDLRHRSHGHCRDFLEHDVHVPDHLALHWPPKAARDATPVVVVNRSVLVSARWNGRIPSVGCVALVPEGLEVAKWMDSFVDNFRHQQYEGSKSLVLVYHHTDHKTAQIVKQHADGLFIKAVAAQDAEFPSTAAARFGMWHVRDADVIARWDFEAWHHPERLNMQVRALALAGRPASLLDRWTILDATNSKNIVEDGPHWDGGIAGQGSWMQEKWYPFLRESEQGVVGSHATEDVVSVDEPGLVVYDSLRP